VATTTHFGGSGWARTLQGLRRLLLVIFLLGLMGTAAELVLTDHYETFLQYIPLLLIALAFPALAWLSLGPNVASVRAWQVLMLLFAASGVIGFALHMQAKVAFTAEVNPALSGVALYWEALQSTSPPALASGIMLQLGLLGLAYTYRHPAVSPESRQVATKKGEDS
jgi:hypothetical protein